MRRPAMLTALAVAATTAGVTPAVAEPPGPYDPYDDPRRDRYRIPLFDDYAYPNDVYDRDRRDRYDRDRRYHRDFRGRWVPIAEGYSARTHRQFIQPRYGARFDRLRVEAVRGAPVIQQIAIEFEGTRDTQVVRLGTRLSPGAGETIRLHRNRGIRRIIVYTDPRYRGRYSIYGA